MDAFILINLKTQSKLNTLTIAMLGERLTGQLHYTSVRKP